MSILQGKEYFFQILFLLSIVHYANSMEEQSHYQMDLLPAQNSRELTIMVTVDNEEKTVYSTQFNSEQLQYLDTLHKQYNIDQSNPLVIPQKQISPEIFKTVEKVTMLLDVFAPGEKKQKKALKKCFKNSEQPDHIFVELLNAANFLGCQLLLSACTEQLYARTKSLYKTNPDQAVALLKKVKIHELSIGIGKHILENSRYLKQLLMTISNKTKTMPVASLGQDTLSLCYSPQGNFLVCYLTNGQMAYLQDNIYYPVPITNIFKPIKSMAFSDDYLLHFFHEKSILITYNFKDDQTTRFNCNPVYVLQGTGLLKKAQHAVYCAPATNTLLFIFALKTIKIYDREIGKIVKEYTHHDCINALAFDPEKKHLYLGCDDRIDAYEIDTAKIVKTFPFTSKIKALRLSKDKKTLFSGDGESNVSWWNIEKGTISKCVNLERADTGGCAYIDGINQLKLSPDGTLLAVASRGIPGFMQLLDTDDGHCIKSFENGSSDCMDFSPDSSTLAAKGDNCILLNKLYDPRLIKRLRKLPAAHIAVLDYCAQALRNDQLIDLSERNQELFDQLPRQIKDYFEQIKNNNKK